MIIEVELPDGRVLEFPEGTSQDVMRQAIYRLLESEKPRGIGQMLYENFIGSGEADTVGERIGEAIRGAGAGAARGLADIPALPVNLAQLATAGVEKAAGMEEPSAVSRFLASLPDTREMLAAVPVIGPESEYVAPGRLGRYIAEASEFAGPAGLFAKAGKLVPTMLRFGAAPGVASEAAGEATEGTALEPYARAGAAIATPVALGAVGRGMQTVISPAGGQITPARREAVELLRQEGIRPTAGQVVGGRAGERQLYREAATEAGRELVEQASGDFTAAIMRRVGSSATRATPEALQEVDARIGAVYNEVVDNVTTVPGPNEITGMSQALGTYRELAASQSAPPIFENINRALVRSFRSGNEIPASTLRVWRQNLSKLTKSPDPATREAAIDGLEVVQNVMEQALIRAGRPDGAARLREANIQYRNFLAIERAAERADVEGILSPLAMRTALLQQSRRQYVQGTRDMSGITRAAADILRPLPQSGTGPRIAAEQFLPNAPVGGAAGLGAFGLGVDPIMATGIGLAATAAPTLRNQFLSSAPGQAYYQNQLLNQFGPIVDQRMIGLLPGLMGNSEEPR
jgi:hypothetical protein